VVKNSEKLLQKITDQPKKFQVEIQTEPRAASPHIRLNYTSELASKILREFPDACEWIRLDGTRGPASNSR
jgi:hypothetical protein